MCSVPKEVSTQVRPVWSKTTYAQPYRYPQFYPEAAQCCIPFSIVFIPDTARLVLGPRALWLQE